MATDSTNLPQGETTLDVGIDMAGSDLDLTSVQTAQTEPANYVDLPKGNVVILLPVQPGQTIKLPTDTTAGLLAKFGPEGNLAFVVDGRTIILQGFVKANEQSPVKIVTSDGDPVDPVDVIASTDPTLDIQTAAGPATGGQGDGADGSGIYIPFLAGPGLGGLLAAGILDPTALQYRLIDDEYKLFTQDEDATPDFAFSFDILGGIVNEDDLGPDAPDAPPQEQFAAAKFVLGGKSGSNGEGNDPFDTEDREQGSQLNPPDELDNLDKNGNGVDDDREPLETVATVKVDFHGEIPGSLTLDLTKLPAGLKSEGELISYQLVPADPGVHGNGIIAFIDNGGTPGEYDDGIDRLVFTVDVDKDKSDGEFKVSFKLYDNLDNDAPAGLIGADELIEDIPVHFTIKDSTGTPVTGTLPLGVQDDIPYFGKVDDCGIELKITHTLPEITHDETPGVQHSADDVSLFNPFVALLGLKLGIQVDDAGFEFPFGDSKGSLIGAAKTQVHVSFGADGPAVFIDSDVADTGVRNSVFGALQDKADGTVDDKVNGGDAAENEHPFELFLANDGTLANDGGKITEGDLTVADQKTNATVTWSGSDPVKVLPVYVQQLDAQTMVGYVQPDGPEGDKVAVFALYIDDNGCLSFYQIHQLNHDVDGPTHPDHDDPFQILGEDGEPLIYVRATDYDGDHAVAPVNLTIEDDGPCFVKTYWGKDGDSAYGVGLIDEDALNGNYGGPGDDKGGKRADGVVIFDFGVDKPGTLAIVALNIKDDGGNTVLSLIVNEEGDLEGANDLKTSDGRAVEIVRSGPDGDGVVTWQAVVAAGEEGAGDPVFTFNLDTAGGDLGEFDFCLHQAIEHPDSNDDPSDDETDNGTDSYEDNLQIDFTVRGYDSDGDYADGSVCLTVDDDSPDKCKVEISFGGGEEDNRLVHDETKGVQDGDDDLNDPDATDAFQDEDDVDNIDSFDSLGLTAIGFAKAQINVDLSGGTGNPDAAYGADGPGTTTPVSIVNGSGGDFTGEKSNLHDTKTGQSIYLFTENGLVVGRVGGVDGPIAFALNVSDTGELEMAQYRAIEHPDTGTRDESVTLLDCNGKDAIIHLQVTVTDADGDAVTASTPLDGCHGNPSIVFQDDGPVVSCADGTLVLAMDESLDLLPLHTGKDKNFPEPDGVQDGSAFENDVIVRALDLIKAGLDGLPLLPPPIGAAAGNVKGLFSVDFGTDDGCRVCYNLSILCTTTNLVDTETQTAITLSQNGGIVEGRDGSNNLVFAVWVDEESGDIVSAQYRAIDHGDEEGAPGAHDEVAFLKDGTIGVTATAYDKDGDSDSKTVDISHAISFDDDGPVFIKTFWDIADGDAPFPYVNNTGQIDEDALPGGIANGPGDGPGDAKVDGTVFFDFGADKPGHIEIQALTVKDDTGATRLSISVDSGGNLVVGTNNLLTVDNKPILIEKSGPNGAGVVVWTAYIDLGGGSKGDPVFEFKLDGAGGDIGDFEFNLLRALEHPLTNDPSTGATETAYEDNLSFDFTVRGYDGDGDSADGHVKITVDDDSPKIAGKTEGCLDEACFGKTGECVSIDAKDENVDFSGTGATNGAIIIAAIHQSGFSGEEVIKNPDSNNVPGFGIESNGDGGSDERHKEINYTGDGSPFDTPGEVLSVKLANADALASCATVELSEFYNGEGGVGAERGQYQLYRDGVPVSGWIAFVGQTPLNATPGSGILTLSIDGPDGGFDEIRFRAIVGSNDGAGGDSSDFNVKSAKFDLAAYKPECITGPINGLYGADGAGDIALINANLPAVKVDGVPVVVTVSPDGHTATGKIGGETIFTLTIDPAAKTYKFEIFSPIDNNPDSVLLKFGYKITDADGDNLSSSIDITVKDGGKPSVGEQQATAQVDEDGLPAGIGDSAPGDQATDPAHNLPNEAYWRGQIILDGGCDGLQDIALSTPGNETGLLTLDGKNIDTVWNAATHTLTGYVEGTDPAVGANQVFTIVLDPALDGSYVLQLLKPVKHADGNQENDVGFNVTVTVTDNDGSTATGSFPVNIDDDIPTLCVEVKWDGRVQHDETPGVDNGTDDDDTGAKVPSYFVGIPGAGAIIGWAEDEEGESSVSVDVDFGADGKGSLNYELDIPGAGTPSGVQTTGGQDIFLFEEGNVVVGRVGNGGPDAAGAVAFAVHVDSDDGDLQVAQFLSLKHPDTGSDDETIDLINSALQVKVTATDKDNDPVSQSVNIGDLVRFDDDGPEAKIEKKHGAEIRLDESKDAAAVDGPADPNANDEANSPGDLTDIAYKTVSGSSLFTVEDDSYGADGAGSKVFSLFVNLTNSGLDDTATGKDVILSQSGNVVTGRAGPGAGDPIVFTITIDPADGDVTVAQFRAVKHDNSSDPDEAGPDANDTGTDEPQTMSGNTLFLTYTVTDGDNDKDSSSIDLGKLFRFEDDGPIARDDTDTVSEGIIQPATGNVISGVDGVLGVDENGEDGVIDDLGTDGFQSIAWQSVVGNTVQGKYGTLTVDANGNYRYDLNEADPDLVTLDTGESDYEEFKYTVKDGDGDTDSAILKIKVNGLSDTSKPNFEDENALVDEDGLPAGILNDPTDPTNDPAPGDDVGGHQEGGLPAVASEAIFRDSLNINWDANVGTIAFSLTNADLASIHPLNGAVLTTANVSGNGTGVLGVWDGVPGASNLILDIKVIDAATSVYEVQLHQPIQHTDPASEDNKSLPVKVTATNAGGTSEHTLTIGIDDDRPVAENDSIAATPGSDGTADVLFIVDVSGSMTNGGGSIVIPGDVPGFDENRLGLARYSMQQLLLGHTEILNVQFVKFDNNVSSSIWMTREDALLYIAEDANFAGGGTTNYDIALQEAMDIYGDSPRPAGEAEQTLVYFLSDGQPNTPDDEGITGNGTAPNVSVTEWETFVTTPANNITNVFAIGLGSAVVSQLEPISYPNDDVDPANGVEDRVIVIPDANITALTQTLDDLLGSVVTPLTGDVTDNDDFGADGAGSPKLVSVTYGPTTYYFTGGVTQHIIDLGAGKGTLKIEDDGDYTYTPPAADGADGAPFFVEYTIRDGDGDNVTGKINIDLTVPPTTDNVFASGNEDNAAGIPVVLTGADSDGTVASFRIISLPANGTLFADSGLTSALAVGDLVPAASNTVYFVPNPNYNGETAFNYAAIDNDGVQDATPATAEITVNPVNDAPVIGDMGGVLAYVENGAAAIIDSSVTVADIDSTNFNGGSLTVAFTLNGTAADQLAISSQGTGNGQIGVSGGNVSFNPPGGAPNAVIGTWSGGNNGNPLVILFNGNATPEAVDALIQRITYANTSENPGTANRTVTFTLVDGDGTANGGSDTGTAIATVTVSPTNDAPTTSNVNASGNEDTTIVVNLSGNDVDGSVTQFKITSLPLNGKLYSDAGLLDQLAVNSIVSAATVFFVPTADFVGDQSFKYSAIDNLGLADATPATASITVTDADPTDAVNDILIIRNGGDTVVQSAWFLRNDTDADGAPSITEVNRSNLDSPTSTVNNPGSSFTIDPNGGNDFTYKAAHGGGTPDQATVDVQEDGSGGFDGDGDNEIIVGTGSGETLNGNAGNDVLFGNGGTDTLNGGAGDDWLVYDNNDIIDGGTDFDTLRFETAFDIQIDGDTDEVGEVNIVNRVNNIEAVDLRNGAADDFGNDGEVGEDALSAADVINMTDVDATLYIMGDNADEVRLDGNWAVGATAQVNDPAHQDIHGLTFTQYTLGGATLFVQSNVDVDNNL